MKEESKDSTKIKCVHCGKTFIIAESKTFTEIVQSPYMDHYFTFPAVCIKCDHCKETYVLSEVI